MLFGDAKASVMQSRKLLTLTALREAVTFIEIA